MPLPLPFFLARELNGVREGTIVAALLVGFIARTIGKKLHFLPGCCLNKKKWGILQI